MPITLTIHTGHGLTYKTAAAAAAAEVSHEKINSSVLEDLAFAGAIITLFFKQKDLEKKTDNLKTKIGLQATTGKKKKDAIECQSQMAPKKMFITLHGRWRYAVSRADMLQEILKLTALRKHRK